MLRLRRPLVLVILVAAVACVILARPAEARRRASDRALPTSGTGVGAPTGAGPEGIWARGWRWISAWIAADNGNVVP